jgi:hypothetical protein
LTQENLQRPLAEPSSAGRPVLLDRREPHGTCKLRLGWTRGINCLVSCRTLRRDGSIGDASTRRLSKILGQLPSSEFAPAAGFSGTGPFPAARFQPLPFRRAYRAPRAPHLGDPTGAAAGCRINLKGRALRLAHSNVSEALGRSSTAGLVLRTPVIALGPSGRCTAIAEGTYR